MSYMSPEAFMCNESDENGNTIKCGRPSDIWSLGCILYQMVYGRTPFADYKTFWAKFKVITDPNHEITYSQLSNPWLVDLMKKTGVPNGVGGIGYGAKDLDALAEGAFAQKRLVDNAPRAMDLATMRALFEGALQYW